MNPRAHLVPREHGLITIRAALRSGLTTSEVQRLVANGDWIALRRGVYVDAATWASSDQWRGIPRLRTRAAHLAVDHAHAFSHDSAAAEHDLPLLPDAHTWVHLTRSDITGGRRRRGIAQHGATYDAGDVVTIDGVPVLGMARTALDLGREHGYAAGLVACDGALRRDVPRSELMAVAERMRHWPGIAAARAAALDADAGAETPGETLLRILVRELGIGEPITQFPLLLPNGRTAWLDMLVGCHDFEFDGFVKYDGVATGGRSAAEVVWEEKKREQQVRARDLGVSRTIWEDFGAGRGAAKARLRHEYEMTVRRFGAVTPPHLLEYAERMRGERERRLRVRRAQLLPPA